jgi:Predicted pPIWI-associating nuclease
VADSWNALIESLSAVERAVARVTAVNVNTSAVRDGARSLVQDYFRRTRPDLRAVGIGEADLESMDRPMQRLLQLANGRNPKRSYLPVLREIREKTQNLEIMREYGLGELRRIEAPPSPTMASGTEAKILDTLKELLPTAALSYEQALRDLHSSTERLSFRGTANELREALRETLDRLAPNEDVMAVSGFKLEKGRTAPTQKQKVRYILRSRQLPETARKAPEASVALIEELTGSLARASYERSSLSAHIASTEREVRQLKEYIDSVLAELLQVHT